MNQLQWINSQQAEMERMLVEWCEVNSGSYHVEGVQRMAELAQQAFVLIADDIEVIAVEPEQSVSDKGESLTKPLGPLLKITKRSNAKYRVLMTGHLDTVFPKDSDFQTCKPMPDNQMNGPGVADMKGGILVILKTLEAFEQTEYADQLGWTVLLNPDEEIGSPGSKALFQAEAKKHQIGLVYEPSALPDGTLAGRRKGSGNFHFIIKGKSAHAGRAFHDGRNAVVAASRLSVSLAELNGQRDNVTINVGKITGGGALNVVPDTTVLRVNVRTYISQDQDWFLSELESILSVIQVDGITVEQSGGFGRPPRLVEGPVLRLFEKVKAVAASMNIDLGWIPTGGVCDGNNLVAAGLPTVDTLGVRGALIHSSDEYICLESLSERSRLSFLLLSICAQDGFSFLEEK